jgi:hypothetical protein
MDLTPLKEEFTFGLNRIYLLFPVLRFTTTYYVSVNKLVLEQFGSEIIKKVPSTKFISYDARHLFTPDSNTIFLYSRNGPHFYKDITKGIWQGATVTYTSLQIAFYMGFEEVILIGVDHNFQTKGKPHSVVTSNKEDRDHFDRRYFGEGIRWQLPDLKTSEIAYQLAKNVFEASGRKVIDATVEGKLDIFPKANYTSLF